MSGKLAYCLSEAIGTFVMMLLGISAIAFTFATGFMAAALPSEHWRLLLTGIMCAGGATLVVYSPVGRISGAHLNPAVSLAFLLKKKLDPKMLSCSWSCNVWEALSLYLRAIQFQPPPGLYVRSSITRMNHAFMRLVNTDYACRLSF